jgi:hypothetical protein
MSIVFGLYFALGPGDEWSRERRRSILPFAGFAIAAAYTLMLHSGSFLNDKMLLHAAAALLIGLGLDAAVRGDPAGRTRRMAFAYSAIFCQLLVLVYPLENYLPTRADEKEGRALLELARGIRGDILFTESGHLARRLGKPSTAHGMPTFDILRMLTDPRDARGLLTASYERALASHRFAAVITADGLVFQPAIDRYYQPAPYPHDERLLLPKTGPAARPRNFYLPRQ